MLIVATISFGFTVGIIVVVISTWILILLKSDCTVTGLESFTVIVNSVWAIDARGLPLIVPLSLLIPNPFGSDGDIS